MSSRKSSKKRVKARPLLSDMPDNIKGLIAENTDVKTRYTLRKVSTHFRAAVDTSKFHFEFVKVEVDRESINMRLNEETRIAYRNNGEHGCVVKKNRNGTEKVIEGVNFIQKAVDDLVIILKSPKGSVKRLWFGNDWSANTNVVPCLQAMLERFRHKLSVRILTTGMCTTQDHVLRLLNLVKPRILKSLDLTYLEGSCDQIVETKHWPSLEAAYLGDVEGTPIAKFLHLKICRMGAFPLTKDDVEQIVQSILQRPNNFDCYDFFTNNIDMNQIWREALSDYWPERRRIPIPGTDYRLEIDQLHDFKIVKFECYERQRS